MELDWEGWGISDGDELYHTKWENLEGTHVIKSPTSGIIGEWGDLGEELDEDDWIVEIDGASESELIAESSYSEVINEMEVGGEFGDSDKTLSYSRWG